ncbi:hypothetical protein NEOLI_000871 [Neolecta irregularis DAH-3]|uniref:Uncharacterized protein n=1 Tax=Neolecta irregularis (strain DAH-3) TaxID=1198029 RepID=A0A1U7LSU7_NEOID|nr:hypothetical protein NEOLI_000871 [Neolecta irregularis DAH-3]|eukprot:OLL25688.1 hypothetical protein NEOLI_000871 [Neolecta irregularis DAH-3]
MLILDETPSTKPDTEAEAETEMDVRRPPSSWKTTSFTAEPGGAVTTQNSAAPAPVEATGDVTLLNPSLLGVIEQGIPRHPWPLHSSLAPKSGSLPACLASLMKIGFQLSVE